MTQEAHSKVTSKLHTHIRLYTRRAHAKTLIDLCLYTHARKHTQTHTSSHLSSPRLPCERARVPAREIVAHILHRHAGNGVVFLCVLWTGHRSINQFLIKGVPSSHSSEEVKQVIKKEQYLLLAPQCLKNYTSMLENTCKEQHTHAHAKEQPTLISSSRTSSPGHTQLHYAYINTHTHTEKHKHTRKKATHLDIFHLHLVPRPHPTFTLHAHMDTYTQTQSD